MFKLFQNWYTRPYTSQHVKLVINFLNDSQELFKKEKSADLGRYGFGGYLRVDSIRGISNPLTLKYMRGRFAEFDEIIQVCDGIEAKFKEYDEHFWSVICDDSFRNVPERIARDGQEFEYLERFVPLKDISNILLRPWG